MSLPFEPRDEDRRLLTGAGRFCDDDRAAGEAHAVFVRSPHAFAAISGIDIRRGPVAAGSPRGTDRRRHGTGRYRQCDPRHVRSRTARVLLYRTARRWPATASAMSARPSRLCRRERGDRARRRRARRSRLRSRAIRSPMSRRRCVRRRRISGPRRRAISRSTGMDSAAPSAPLSMPLSPGPRMSRGSVSSISASSWRRWSRAARWRATTATAIATFCPAPRRAPLSCDRIWRIAWGCRRSASAS